MFGYYRNGIGIGKTWRKFSKSTQSSKVNIFDTQTKRIQKDRTTHLPDYNVYDYLREEKGLQMVDRMHDIKRNFKLAVDFGCGRGYISRHLTTDTIERLIQCDISKDILNQIECSSEVQTETVHVDGESFPFDKNSLDLVVSSLSLHWVNDLPGVLKQMQQALRPDGCLLGCMFGGDTLYQLRVSIQLAEMEREGGFAPHISPFTDNRDLGRLLNAANFGLLSIDVDEITVNYPTMFELMHDLKGMGENNCSWNRKLHLRRETLMAAAAIYQNLYGNEDTSIPATFQFIHFIGWKPDPSQPKSAARGSGEISLKDISEFSSVTDKENNRQ